MLWDLMLVTVYYIVCICVPGYSRLQIYCTKFILIPAQCYSFLDSVRMHSKSSSYDIDNPANRVDWSKQSTRLTPPFLSFSGFRAALHLMSNTLLILSCCLCDSPSHSATVSGVRATLCIVSSTSRTVTPCLFRAYICQGSISQVTRSAVTGGEVAGWVCKSLKLVGHLCLREEEETSCAAVDVGSRKSQIKGHDSLFRTAG